MTTTILQQRLVTSIVNVLLLGFDIYNRLDAHLNIFYFMDHSIIFLNISMYAKKKGNKARVHTVL